MHASFNYENMGLSPDTGMLVASVCGEGGGGEGGIGKERGERESAILTLFPVKSTVVD